MSGMCDRNLAEDWTWGGNIVDVPQTAESVTRIEIEKGAIWPYVYGSFSTKDEEWYRDAARNIYLCPTVGEVGKIRGLSYSMNFWLDGHQENPFLFGTLLADIPSPQATFLIVEENELTLNDGSFLPRSFESGTDQSEVHGGGANHVFCDGHVQWMSREALEERMQSGEGFEWQQ
jgi:prepilin-type processing-associated H-X9-DG protein